MNNFKTKRSKKEFIKKSAWQFEQVFLLECPLCDEESHFAYTHENDAAEVAYINGWRFFTSKDEMGLICPDCIEEERKDSKPRATLQNSPGKKKRLKTKEIK